MILLAILALLGIFGGAWLWTQFEQKNARIEVLEDILTERFDIGSPQIMRKVGFPAYNQARILIAVDCDRVTANELVTKAFPGIAKIVKDGSKRAKGEPVNKPCGCSE